MSSSVLVGGGVAVSGGRGCGCVVVSGGGDVYGGVVVPGSGGADVFGDGDNA